MKKLLLIVVGFIAGRKYEDWIFDGGLDKGKIKFIKMLYKFLTGCDFDDRYEDVREKYGPPVKRMDYKQYYSTRRNHNGK